MRRLYRTVALGGVIAAFFMMYIYQHFRCIDLSFQLEDVKVRQAEAASLNSSLKLEIAGLRNPMRIDVIARRQLGLTEPLPTQVQEYEAPAGAEVAAARYLRPNRAP
jgi:cell division protein FtsL